MIIEFINHFSFFINKIVKICYMHIIINVHLQYYIITIIYRDSN